MAEVHLMATVILDDAIRKLSAISGHSRCLNSRRNVAHRDADGGAVHSIISGSRWRGEELGHPLIEFVPEEHLDQWVSQVNCCRLRHIGADAILAPFAETPTAWPRKIDAGADRAWGRPSLGPTEPGADRAWGGIGAYRGTPVEAMPVFPVCDAGANRSLRGSGRPGEHRSGRRPLVYPICKCCWGVFRCLSCRCLFYCAFHCWSAAMSASTLWR